ncbi:uncharacterized protein DEA37_0007365 [Paragonimus westermani]|uniref:Guanylate cyclase domain-containing protein n=1 Tax=Paragonimus westermani TaxID=34504 RepID=A0A5J4NRJ9_9TREM|nr:uncharacterized protein DEA37_0007365 [Paragonimus westermani]
MFDRSRDIILSGDQQSEELMKLFKKTFDSVSICFTKVVNFGAKCMRINVEQIIGLLNNMYTLFDALTESHKVYKGKGEMETFFIEGRDLHFTFFDNNLRSRRNFIEILKEDFEQNDDVPSEEYLSSDSVSFELSEDISEEMDGGLQQGQSATLKVEATGSKTGTLTNRKPHHPSPGKKAEGSDPTKSVEAQSVKAQDIKQVGKVTAPSNSSKVSEQNTRSSKPNTQSTADVRTRKIGIAAPTAIKEQSKKEDHSQNQESVTTRVLSEAARRLVVTKANNTRQKESKRQPDVTFASGAPSEILNEPFDAEMIVEDGDEPKGSTRRTSSPLKIRSVNGNGTIKVTGRVSKTDDKIPTVQLMQLQADRSEEQADAKKSLFQVVGSIDCGPKELKCSQELLSAEVRVAQSDANGFGNGQHSKSHHF